MYIVGRYIGGTHIHKDSHTQERFTQITNYLPAGPVVVAHALHRHYEVSTKRGRQTHVLPLHAVLQPAVHGGDGHIVLVPTIS
jgi:hypothetical protein